MDEHDCPKRTRAEQARINGRKSRGPLTAEGKARSRMNALKHGLTNPQNVVLAHECPKLYRKWRKSFFERFQPRDPVESQLVLTMCNAQWRLRRCESEQTALIDLEVDALDRNRIEPMDVLTREAVVVTSVPRHRGSVAMLLRYEAAAHSAYRHAHRELLALRANYPVAAEPGGKTKSPCNVTLVWKDGEEEEVVGDGAAHTHTSPKPQVAPDSCDIEPIPAADATTPDTGITDPSSPAAPAHSDTSNTDTSNTDTATPDAVTTDAVTTGEAASDEVAIDPSATDTVATCEVTIEIANSDAAATDVAVSDPSVTAAVATGEVATEAVTTDPIATGTAPTDAVTIDLADTDASATNPVATGTTATNAVDNDEVDSDTSATGTAASDEAASDEAVTEAAVTDAANTSTGAAGPTPPGPDAPPDTHPPGRYYVLYLTDEQYRKLKAPNPEAPSAEAEPAQPPGHAS